MWGQQIWVREPDPLCVASPFVREQVPACYEYQVCLHKCCVRIFEAWGLVEEGYHNRRCEW